MKRTRFRARSSVSTKTMLGRALGATGGAGAPLAGAEPAVEVVPARRAEPPQPLLAQVMPARSAAVASATRRDFRRRRGFKRATPACALAMSAHTLARGAGGERRTGG